MRVVFLGTPDFAVAPLKALVKSHHQVVAVVTQPDRANARGNKITVSPVKAAATDAGLPVYQFENISAEGEDVLRDFNADIMVTAAYGQILRQNILDIAPHGIINIHASLLPKYRGSSPVQTALINGEKEIGVTVMQTELSVDSGDIILQKKVALNGLENTADALSLLSDIGASAVTEALDAMENGTATFTPQDVKDVTFCAKLTKEGGKLDFSQGAECLVNLIRGYTPNPSAFCETDFGRLKILSAAVSDIDIGGENGEVIYADKKRLTVKCGVGAIDILILQRENARALPIEEFLRGKPIKVGSVFK